MWRVTLAVRHRAAASLRGLLRQTKLLPKRVGRKAFSVVVNSFDLEISSNFEETAAAPASTLASLAAAGLAVISWEETMFLRIFLHYLFVLFVFSAESPVSEPRVQTNATSQGTKGKKVCDHITEITQTNLRALNEAGNKYILHHSAVTT